MIKLTALIIFDILVIMTPLLINISPGLVNGVAIFMFVASLLTLVTIVFNSKTSDFHTGLLKEAKMKPKWWNVYDVITDVLFITSWSYVGWESLAAVLIVTKLFTAIKYPDYYAKRGKQDD